MSRLDRDRLTNQHLLASGIDYHEASSAEWLQLALESEAMVPPTDHTYFHFKRQSNLYLDAAALMESEEAIV